VILKLRKMFEDTGRDIIEYNELRKEIDLDSIGH
jgi:hypothetical protein